MTFNQMCLIAASRERVWDFLLDMEKVARCLPGAENLNRVDDQNYEGTLKVRIGPIALALRGTISVESMDRERWQGVLRADAKDSRLGGGVRARILMELAEPGPGATQMNVTLEAHILGKIGEFGQPVMKKKADAMLLDFAQQVGAQLAAQ